MMNTNARGPDWPNSEDPVGLHAEQQAASANNVGITEPEIDEIVTRIGRGVRALVSETLIDPVPREFQRLLDTLERREQDFKPQT